MIGSYLIRYYGGMTYIYAVRRGSTALVLQGTNRKGFPASNFLKR